MLQNVNKNRYTELDNKSENINEWNVVRNGPSGVIPKSNLVFQHSNRFNVFQNETSGENNNDNNDTNTQYDINNDRIRHNNNMHKPNREKKKPNPVINQYPERDTLFKRNANNNNNSRKCIRILSDSIPKGMKVKDMNNFVHNGYVKLKSFPGATIRNLNHYAMSTLEEDKPDIVIVHVGINNLLNPMLANESDENIAEEIINIGKNCQSNSVEKVMISGIVKCSKINPSRIRNVNNLLSEKCKLHNYIFIDNDRIENFHLWKDGLHLIDSGKASLLHNYVDILNTFLYHSSNTQPWT